MNDKRKTKVPYHAPPGYHAPPLVYYHRPRKRAGNIWLLCGFVLGFFAVILALATDEQDGRVAKALAGWIFGWGIVSLLAGAVYFFIVMAGVSKLLW